MPDIDPDYYANDPDGNEPSGVWLTSAAYQEDRIAGSLRARWYPVTLEAVNAGRAEWVRQKDQDIPF